MSTWSMRGQVRDRPLNLLFQATAVYSDSMIKLLPPGQAKNTVVFLHIGQVVMVVAMTVLAIWIFSNLLWIPAASFWISTKAACGHCGIIASLGITPLNIVFLTAIGLAMIMGVTCLVLLWRHPRFVERYLRWLATALIIAVVIGSVAHRSPLPVSWWRWLPPWR